MKRKVGNLIISEESLRELLNIPSSVKILDVKYDHYRRTLDFLIEEIAFNENVNIPYVAEGQAAPTLIMEITKKVEIKPL